MIHARKSRAAWACPKMCRAFVRCGNARIAALGSCVWRMLRGTHHDFGAPSCRSARSCPARARLWAARRVTGHINRRRSSGPIKPCGASPVRARPAVCGRPAQGDLGPPTDRGRVMRRADHIGQLQERVLHPKRPVPHRLDPPGIEARGARGMPLQAANSAPSSMISPRARFTRMASSFMRASPARQCAPASRA